MVDRWIDGSIRRISPEAPVPVVEVQRTFSHLGGAANVAGLIGHLGVGVGLLGVVGDDETGRDLADLLAAAGVQAELVSDPTRPTTRKTRVVSGGHQVCRYDEEVRGEVGAEVEDELRERAIELVSEADVLVLSDYGKGCLTESVVWHCLELAACGGVPVLADPTGATMARYGSVDVLKPNRIETLHALGLGVDEESSTVELAGQLREQVGCQAVMVTDGPNGICLASETIASRISGHPREVVDVTGAGDAVAAGVAIGLALGADLEQAATLGNAAGAAAVSKKGTAPISRNDLLGVLGA